MQTLLHQAIVAVPLLAVLIVVALRSPRLGDGLFRHAERGLNWLARRPRSAQALICLVGIITAASVSWRIGIPKPAVHDEFSYLLAADTFAHGRLANPPHPMWMHFESFHVLQLPTYASKYPPGEGLMLAAGQVSFRQPVAGIWLTMGLTCGAVCWMLRAWMPARWAVLGGLLATINLALLESCGTYWGGNLAALGGVLAVGGFRWTVLRPGVGHTFLLGAGIALLAITRPYEGFLLTLGLLCGVVVWAAQQKSKRRAEMGRAIALPLAVILMLTFGGIGFYNRSVTGSAFRLPYVLHEEMYGVAPLFLFQRPRQAPRYHHDVMRKFHMGDELAAYYRQRNLRGFVAGALGKVGDVSLCYLRPLLLGLPLITLPWVLRRDPWIRGAALIFGFFLVGLLLETWWSLHYITPVFGLVWVFVIQGMRTLSAWRLHHNPTGRFLVRAIVVVGLLAWIKWYGDYARLERKPLGSERATVIAQLERIPGDHLVLVAYRSNHDTNSEWVYNGAEIDRSRVVWARAMGDAADREIETYFASRRIWRLDADATPPRLTPVGR